MAGNASVGIRASFPAVDELVVRQKTIMKEESRSLTSDVALRRWQRATIILALTTACSLTFLAATVFLAAQTLGTHYNLYYLLWKVGIRTYERPIAFGGLFHDHSYRQRFIGMTVAQFEQAFPNTFYKVRTLPPNAKPNQEIYIDSYHQAEREDWFHGMGWSAVFENERLVEFNIFKG